MSLVTNLDMCNGVVAKTPSSAQVVLFPLGHPPLGGTYACFFNQLGQCPGVEVRPIHYSRDNDGWIASMTLRYMGVDGGTADHVFFSEGPAKTKRGARDMTMAVASPMLPLICDGSRFPPLSYRRRRVGFVDVSGKVALT